MNSIQDTRILKLDVAGFPVEWASPTDIAILQCKNRILWSLGEEKIILRGGWNDKGERSVLELASIVAVNDGIRRFSRGLVPPLTNRELFKRDKNMCLYCGNKFPASQLTRDHVSPRSKGGPDIWSNVVSACAPCNHAKGNYTLDEIGMRLIALPYTPNIAERMILMNRNILADQMEFLQNLIQDRSSRLPS